MNKKLKLKSLLVLTFTLSFCFTNVTFASVTQQSISTTASSNITKPQPINLTPEDISKGKEKLKLAEQYCENKKATMSLTNNISPNSTGWGGSNYINVPYYVEQPNMCGPASAQIAIIYKYPDYGNGQPCPAYFGKTITQDNLAVSLAYSTGNGTPFSSRWTDLLNSFMPSNNYTILSAPGYTASDWKSHMENGIIYTVDKGYPVVVDTHMLSTADVSTPPRVNSAYSYLDDRGRGCYHYIIANGYNNTPGNDLIYITDCSNFPSFPHSYWCSASSLASVSYQYGIVY